MFRNKTVQRFITTLLMLALGLTPFSVHAAPDLNQTGSISITTRDRESKEIVSDAVFRLYCVATARLSDNSFSLTYTDPFKDNGMTLRNHALSDEYLSVHLMVYATQNNIPYTEKASNEAGNLVFDNLSCGAYLVVPVAIKEGYLKPNPFLVTIPSKNEDEWLYHTDATPKVEVYKETDQTISIRAQKQWEGTTKTPDSVTVSLVKDGLPIDTVSLNADNNWYHEWTGLEKNHAWYVIESSVPDDYEVSYSASQKTVTITNSTTPSGDEPPLIQTGQLNWPVPVLLIAGLTLFSLGWAMLHFFNKDEEAT